MLWEIVDRNVVWDREREIVFLSRLPENFSSSGTAKTKAFSNEVWIEIGRISEWTQSALYSYMRNVSVRRAKLSR